MNHCCHPNTGWRPYQNKYLTLQPRIIMNKTDGRHYNRKSQRDLKIEMDLFVLFNKRHILVPGNFYDDKPVEGIIVDVTFIPDNHSRHVCVLSIDNGTEYRFPVRHGKPAMRNEVIIDGQTPAGYLLEK